MRLNIDENRTRVKLFLATETYTFSLEHMPDGREFQHNGYITGLYDWYFTFFDCVANREIGLILEACSVERNKEEKMTEKEAKEIFMRWKDGNRLN